MISACNVCAVEGSEAKYKCPKCVIPYCSLQCWKIHKSTNCEPQVANRKELEPPLPSPLYSYDYPTEDTVPPEKLALLKNSKTLKHILSNPHVRDILIAIDKAENPSNLIQAAMVEPIFVEFADECTKIVEPYSDK